MEESHRQGGSNVRSSPGAQPLRLGLIGGAHIASSKSPKLHASAALLGGLLPLAAYELLVPEDLGLELPAIIDRCRERGFRGVNVTMPYKEAAHELVSTEHDPLLGSLGAVNTIVFSRQGGIRGYNTDFTGFVAAYRAARGYEPPGVVCQIGAGGVGKAIAFGLLALGASEIRIVERAECVEKAAALAAALRSAGATSVSISTDVAVAAAEADGLLNCTPLGMAGVGGMPLEAEHISSGAHQWAFDAVYVPQETAFLRLCSVAGLCVISGRKLFLAQGVDAFRLFSGVSVPTDDLEIACFPTEVGSTSESTSMEAKL